MLHTSVERVRDALCDLQKRGGATHFFTKQEATVNGDRLDLDALEEAIGLRLAMKMDESGHRIYSLTRRGWKAVLSREACEEEIGKCVAELELTKEGPDV